MKLNMAHFHYWCSPQLDGMGNTATVVYKRLASLHADKFEKPYSKITHWLRCRLSFSLLCSSIMCIRGSRSAIYRSAVPCSSETTLTLSVLRAGSLGKINSLQVSFYIFYITTFVCLFLAVTQLEAPFSLTISTARCRLSGST